MWTALSMTPFRAQAVLTVAEQTVKQRETVSEQITTLAQK